MEEEHMQSKVQAVPKGYRSLTPHIVVRNLPKAVEFYENAFGAVVKDSCTGPDGKLCHADLQIGDSMLMVCEEFPSLGALSPLSAQTTGTTIHLYVANCDEVFAKALKYGAKQKMPVSDQFWGDRYGQVVDPFGHFWAVATCIEDVSPAEMKKRVDEQFASACN
jgi:PhnB protein